MADETTPKKAVAKDAPVDTLEAYEAADEAGCLPGPPADPTDYTVAAGGGPDHPLPGTPGGEPLEPTPEPVRK